ncbi:MAG: hypothetical protein IKL57_01045 [Oscillospiraceae bacterium]|nr:hypothetical protein [Oscillospiraceae bacterium]
MDFEIIADNLETLGVNLLNGEKPQTEDDFFALGYAAGYFRAKEEEQ